MSARFSAGQAAWAAGAQLLSGAPGQVFEGVFTDSRTPVRGALFVALVGERHDGSVFAAAAAQAGAAGVLVPSVSATRVREELAAQGLRPAILAGPDTGRALGGLAHAWRQSLPGVRVVCVTGSTGKTSTKELVAAVLETAGPTLKTEGNLNNEVGVPLTLLRLTPGHLNAVIEAGMNHLGEIARLAGWADPDVGLVTLTEFVEQARAITQASTLPRSMIATRSHSISTSLSRCEFKNTVVPRELRARIRSRTSRRPIGSSADVGSSSRSRRGLWTIAWARPMRCSMPLE